MRKFKVCVDGKPFERHINGTFDNPEQEVPVSMVLTGEAMKVELKGGLSKDIIENMAIVVVAEPTDIHWTDREGNPHIVSLVKDEKLFIEKKFLA